MMWCGCCDKFFLVLYDVNKVRDDYIEVSINGNVLGTVTHSSSNCTPGGPFDPFHGRYFAEDTSITGTNPVVPIPPGFYQSTVLINRSMLIDGTDANTVRFESVQDNGCDVFMFAICGLARANGAAWASAGNIPLNPDAEPTGGTEIIFPSGVGNYVEKTFTWPVP